MLLADSLKLGAPLTPRILLGVIGNNFDKYLIGQVASLGGVGIYSIGQRVANIAFTYMTALQNVFGPQVYTRMFSGAPDAGVSIGRYLTPFAYVSTLLAFVVAIFSEEILRVLAPGTYLGAIPIIAILVLYYAIQFFGKMPQIAYARQTYLISMLAALSTGLNVAFGAAGIWLWGTIGAAWGILAAGLVMSTVTFVVGQRCFRIDWEKGPLVAMFGLLFGSAFLILVLRAVHTPYPVLAIVKLCALAAFLGLGGSLGIITRKNLGVVRDLVSGRLRRAGLVRNES
jgi:O-antigen/teichoic acid export membrane protein